MDKAKILKQMIDEQGYNMKSFAAKCGIPYTTLVGILKNGAGKASVDNIIIICKNLGIQIEDLDELAKGTSSIDTQPNYDDLKNLIARNGKNMSTDERMQLIKMLSEL